MKAKQFWLVLSFYPTMSGAKATNTVQETGFKTVGDYTTTEKDGQVIALTPIDRLAAWDQEMGFWDDQSFNESFKLPPVNMDVDDDTIVNSLLFTFQAQAPGEESVRTGATGQRQYPGPKTETTHSHPYHPFLQAFLRSSFPPSLTLCSSHPTS
jgi:hypothetical protein